MAQVEICIDYLYISSGLMLAKKLLVERKVEGANIYSYRAIELPSSKRMWLYHTPNSSVCA